MRSEFGVRPDSGAPTATVEAPVGSSPRGSEHGCFFCPGQRANRGATHGGNRGIYQACLAGPVLFKQERVGYLGNTFTCFKFRSMKADVEVKSHQDHATDLIQRSDIPMLKMDKGDPRLIPGGRMAASERTG